MTTRNEVWPPTTAWMGLKAVMLSEKARLRGYMPCDFVCVTSLERQNYGGEHVTGCQESGWVWLDGVAPGSHMVMTTWVWVLTVVVATPKIA